jgi:hypothetical protein
MTLERRRVDRNPRPVELSAEFRWFLRLDLVGGAVKTEKIRLLVLEID